MLTQLKYMNESGSIISAAYEDSFDEEANTYTHFIALEKPNPLFDKAISGEYGEIEEFVEVHYPDNISVTKLRFLMALQNGDLLNKAIEFVGDDPMRNLVWNESITFERTSRFIEDMVNALELSDEEMNDIFYQARDLNL